MPAGAGSGCLKHSLEPASCSSSGASRQVRVARCKVSRCTVFRRGCSLHGALARFITTVTIFRRLTTLYSRHPSAPEPPFTTPHKIVPLDASSSLLPLTPRRSPCFLSTPSPRPRRDGPGSHDQPARQNRDTNVTTHAGSLRTRSPPLSPCVAATLAALRSCGCHDASHISMMPCLAPGGPVEGRSREGARGAEHQLTTVLFATKFGARICAFHSQILSLSEKHCSAAQLS